MVLSGASEPLDATYLPPALTLLFELIFPCLKTQAQENNKVKYIHLM